MNKVYSLITLLFLICNNATAQTININPDPNGEPWVLGPGSSLGDSSAIYQVNNQALLEIVEQVDNSQESYFYRIFNQSPPGEEWGSCAQASGVTYTFGYELNRFNGSNGDLDENTFPFNYTYNYLDGGIHAGSAVKQGWNIIIDNGCPDLTKWGDFFQDSVWMDGYEKYESGIRNRVVNLDDPYFDLNIPNYNTISDLKTWICNHNQPGANSGGLAVFSKHFENPIYAQSVNGEWYIQSWSPDGFSHAMTLVGYDDNINLGAAGFGAFKIANSWGDTWMNGGFIWLPYSLVQNEGLLVSGINEVESRQPSVIAKIKLKHESRDKIQLYIHISDNPFTTPPPYYLDYSKEFKAMSYRSGGQLPMNGERNNNNPIVIGYDISDYIDEHFNEQELPRLKFILGILEYDDNNEFDGEVLEFSILDYRKDPDHPFEVYSHDHNVPIANDDWTNLTVDYFVLPDIDQTAAINFNCIVRDNISIINSSTITFTGQYLDFYDNGNLNVQAGSVLTIGSNVKIYSQRESGMISVFGEISLNDYIQVIRNFGCHFSLYIENQNLDLEVDNITFRGTIIAEEISSLNLSNSEFLGSEIISKYGGLSIQNCSFSNTNFELSDPVIINEEINISSSEFENCQIISNAHPLGIIYSVFNNSVIIESLNSLDISHSKFFHSSIMASNPTMGCFPIDNAANITDCYFQTAYNEAHSIIELYGYKQFNILTDTIDNVNNPSNTCHGISIHYSGSVEPNSEHVIADNIIYCSFNGCDNDLSGITLYSSIADIQNNYIHSNQIGIQSLNYSRLYINGNSNANFEDQTQRIINNGFLQLYASRDAFPLEFHWNSVYGDVSDCFIFHDVDMSLQPPDVNVANNYWGPVFDPDVNLCPERHYDYEPVWQLQGVQLGISAAQQLLLTGINQIGDSSFTQAKSTFQQVIVQYPDEEPAKNALKEILYLEPLAGNDFEGLKTWYLTDSVIVNNEVLNKIAGNLANKCDEKLENYPEAIDWYETIIEDPESLEDSIFAIIDLEHLYWQMGIDTNLRSASYFGRLSQFRPESFNAFREHKDELLSLLHKSPGRQSNQNVELPMDTCIFDKSLLWSAPNPFSGKTQIHFYLMMESDIQLNVFNNVGQMIYSIVETNKQKGAVKFEFDASDLNSGVYFYQVVVNGVPTGCQKMIIL